MCLVVKEPYKIAEQDIKCYKLIYIIEGVRKTVYTQTPFPDKGEEFGVDNKCVFEDDAPKFDMSIITATLYKEFVVTDVPDKEVAISEETGKVLKPHSKNLYNPYNYGYLYDEHTGLIYSGAIHSFAEFNDIEKKIFKTDKHVYDQRIIECIIPKGTKYYEGYSFGPDQLIKPVNKHKLSVERLKDVLFKSYASERVIVGDDVTDKFITQ